MARHLFSLRKILNTVQFFPIEFGQIEKELVNFRCNCPYIDPQEATIRNTDRVSLYIISYGCKLAQHSSNLAYVQLVFLLMLSRAKLQLGKNQPSQAELGRGKNNSRLELHKRHMSRA